MKFTRENYEAYVLYWLEGKLSGPDHDLFLIFLKENPDIYEEIEAANNVRLEPSSVQFHDKNILKKNISESRFGSDFENLCVAFLEGDLESAEMQKFESGLSENPDKLVEFELFRKSRLEADQSIVFSPKSKLKKLTVYQKRIRIFSTASAAAIIVLIIIFTRNIYLPDPNLISDTEKVVGTSVKKEIMGEMANVERNNPQLTDNQLVNKDQKFYKPSGSNVDYMTENNWPGLITDISELNRVQEEIRPVLSKFTTVENDNSVDLKRLKRTESGPSGNFDTYMTPGEFAGNKILNSLFPGKESLKQTKLSFWALASTSFEELNQITDGGYSLERKVYANGKLKRISIETPLLGISIPLKNRQPQ